MSKSFEKYQKRRLKSSYLSVVISIALVLFMVGILGMVVLKSTKIAAHFKEKVAVTLFLKENVSEEQAKVLEQSLKRNIYVNTTEFISKEDAAKAYSEDLGEDFLEFLGTNPLKNAIDIHLKSDYVDPEKMEVIKAELLNNSYVLEVIYDAPLIHLLTQNIQKISFWILVIAGFFTIVAILLINSSIRLSIYSKRFTIKTMQMVGATRRFIRKPFILKSIQLGVFGALIASLGLGFVLYSISEQLPELDLLSNPQELAYVFGGIFGAGIFITWASTFLATQRFLNLKTDQLY